MWGRKPAPDGVGVRHPWGDVAQLEEHLLCKSPALSAALRRNYPGTGPSVGAELSAESKGTRGIT